MKFDFTSWTIFGVVRWVLAGAALTIIFFVLSTFADENVRSVLENYGWDKILSQMLATMPNILFHRETWFVVGLVIGTAAAVWLVWAFPHRLGESNAHETPLRKWSIVIAIVVILVGLVSYLHFGQQPTLHLSDEDVVRVTAPVQKQLETTEAELERAKKEAQDAKQSLFVPVSVESLPTYTRLQFNNINENPAQIDTKNVHWSTFAYVDKVSKYCPSPALPDLCAIMPARGDKNDIDQTFIRIDIFFDRPIIYKNLNVNVFGAKVGSTIREPSNRMAIVELTPEKTVTSFVVDIKATP